MSQIESWLFLGGLKEATDINFLYNNSIDSIINVAYELRNTKYPKSVEIHNFLLQDTPSEGIELFFESVFDIIEANRHNNKRVLIHCFMGISRSASFVIYYLMRTRNWDFHESFEYVENIRPCIDPNPGFIEKLKIAFCEMRQKILDIEFE